MKIHLESVGCRLNQSEIETFGRQFRSQGHELVPRAEDADLVVVNTCAVTSQAASDSRQKLRQASRAGAPEIVATGCWVTMEPQSASALPGVNRVFLNQAKEHLVADLLQTPPEQFDLEPVAREPLPGFQMRTRAFIKVQDGCDNRCTFCVTTLARGAARSYPIERVLADVRAAVRGGTREVVLTGVHLGSWGHDFSPPRLLRDLVRTILDETEVDRLRLSSVEPWDLDEEFFAMWGNEPRLCRQLHLPLQSGCDRTLRRMARKTTQESFARLIRLARQVCPEIAITTDLIAGFPGETEAEFQETLAFVGEMAFAGGHVFTYSERPGTAAAGMPRRVPHQVRKARNRRLRELLRTSGQRYRSGFLASTLPVLWETATGLGPDGWQLTGWTDNYLRVQATAPQELWNQITPVRMERLTDSGLAGQIALPAIPAPEQRHP